MQESMRGVFFELWSKRRWWLVGGAALAVVAIAAVLLLRPQPSWPDPQLTAASRATSFPLYYPAHLPQGFHYVKGSVKTSDAVVIYALSFDSGKQVFVSAIPKPAGVVFDDFYNRLLNNKTNVLSSEGKAVIGNAGGQNIGSLVTDKTWVTLNTKQSIDDKNLKDLVSSLKRL